MSAMEVIEAVKTMSPSERERVRSVLDSISGNRPAGKKEDDEAFLRSAGGWSGLVDADALIRDIYCDRLISTRPEPSTL
jgi:hypothetical protein